MLREIAQLDRQADRDGSRVRLGRAGHQLQQSRFAGAVDAHDAPPLLAADDQIEVLVDGLAAEALIHALQHRDVVAGTGRLREFEGYGLAALWRLETLDLVDFLDPALHLAGVRGARL